jgi:integrase
LRSLTVAGLTAIIEEWEDEDYAPATINRRLSFLKTGLRLAKLPLQVDFKELHRREDNVRDVYVSPAEFAALYTEAQAYDQDLADFLTWLYVSGMRRGEAAQLTVSMLDTGRWVLLIPGRVQKHKKHRGIFIDGALRALLERRLAARVRGCDYLFHRAGERIRSFSKSWTMLCAKAGLTGIWPHDLRRAAVTNLLEQGFTPKEAMAITGHRTLSVFTRYQQLPEASFRAKLAAMPLPGGPPLAA